MRDLFLLDPTVTFLNHGSFGATPRPVFEAYQAWQRELERQPVYFMERTLIPALQVMRERLGRFLHASADDLLPIPNATFGVNLVARSLALQPGDEVLTTDQEYGACDTAWQQLCAERGILYRRQPVPLPLGSAQTVADQIWAGVTPRTRVLFFSHITSFTAATFPAQELCRRAREAGILTVIDGAHAPNQLDLDLGALSADFYIGNCHKWLMAPKGSAFLYTDPAQQTALQPLIISWDFSQLYPELTPYLGRLQWWGTRDPAAHLAVINALDFVEAHDWSAVRQRCHPLVTDWLAEMSQITGYPPLYNQPSDYVQMGVAELPPQANLPAFKRALYDQYRVEIPCLNWQGRHFIRISVQGYNSADDVQRCLDAVRRSLSA